MVYDFLGPIFPEVFTDIGKILCFDVTQQFIFAASQFSGHTEFYRCFDVKHFYTFLPQMLEHEFRLLFADGHRHLDRLISQFKEMRGVQFAIMSEAFASGDQRCTTDAQFHSSLQQPFSERLVVVLTVLLSEKSQLIASHSPLPKIKGS